LSVDSDVAEIGVICGPTAAGKSAVALWLAGSHPVTIISADSRQIYRDFDIGTAKPTRIEQARVPHRGIDIVDPTERYSAAAWADAAEGWIEEARRSNRIPLVVGGTGLYLRALFEGLFVEPPLDPTLRASLETILGELSVDELRRWVEVLDPPRAHLGRPQLLRAVEIALLTGQRLSDLHRSSTRPARWRPRYLLVDPGAGLASRIAERIDEMLDHGWPDEVRGLMQTVPEDAPAWNATGYDTVRALVRGDLSRLAAREQILIATRQYAKRQRTWFRNQLPSDRVTQLDPRSVGWEHAVAAWAQTGLRAAQGIA
jgi:tRNA isopentenyltransferase (miaA)